MPNAELIKRIRLDASELSQFIKGDTANPIIHSFRALEVMLESGEEDSVLEETAEKTLPHVEKLIDKLKLASDAVAYAKKHLKPTNRPVDKGAHRTLEKARARINTTDLIKTFGVFKEKREKIDSAVPGHGIKQFDQAAYRKGTGMNIRQWAHHILTEHDKEKGLGIKTPLPGNCTEQSNLAFSYLYGRFNETYAEDEDRVKLFSRLERIDIENASGGHALLLLDRDPSREIFTDKKSSATDLLSRSDELGDECIVIDPWHDSTPIYLASDMAMHMPSCGQTGRVNIEFGLDFSDQDPSPTARLP